MISSNVTASGMSAACCVPAMLQRPEVLEQVQISTVAFGPLEGRLNRPFVIASDQDSKVDRLDNVLVMVHAGEDLVGLGEAAPFSGISKDSQELLLGELKRIAPTLHGATLNVFELESLLKQGTKFPAARAAVEMAFFDVLAKRQSMPLAEFLNPGIDFKPLFTDITIPIVAPKEAVKLALEYGQQGFNRIKIKVGDNFINDAERVSAVHVAYEELGRSSSLDLLIDANEGYSAQEAIDLICALQAMGFVPAVFEQPVKRDDIVGLSYVRDVVGQVGTLVFADESVYTEDDAEQIAERNAADGINLKVMKHGGLIEAMRIAEVATRGGLKLMVGGMVETKLAMSASLHLSHAIGVPFWLDLDTPLLLEEGMLAGGMLYEGAKVMLSNAPGIGVSLKGG